VKSCIPKQLFTKLEKDLSKGRAGGKAVPKVASLGMEEWREWEARMRL